MGGTGQVLYTMILKTENETKSALNRNTLYNTLFVEPTLSYQTKSEYITVLLYVRNLICLSNKAVCSVAIKLSVYAQITNPVHL